MPTICKVCNHPNRLEIDRELIQGRPYSMLANKYDINWQTLRRHHHMHLTRQMTKAYEIKQDSQNDVLMQSIEELTARTKAILEKAEKTNKMNTALNAIRELRGIYEFMAKVAFSLHTAKMQEIQAAGLNDQGKAQGETIAYKVLNDAELRMLSLLLHKIEANDQTIDVAEAFGAPSETDRLEQLESHFMRQEGAICV